MKQFDCALKQRLHGLNLTWMLQNIDQELASAARKNLSCEEFLNRVVAGESDARAARAVERRIRTAKLHNQSYSLQQYDFSHPVDINADLVRHLFTLNFIRENKNLVFIGGVGLGKTHLAKALAYEACKKKHAVVCENAMHLINTLLEAAAENRLEAAMKKFTKPRLLLVDELGYIPLDRPAAEMFFQLLARRYESQEASTIITTNRAFADWPKTFANDATLTSAVLDRVVHRCEVVMIKGTSYRMREKM